MDLVLALQAQGKLSYLVGNSNVVLDAVSFRNIEWKKLPKFGWLENVKHVLNHLNYAQKVISSYIHTCYFLKQRKKLYKFKGLNLICMHIFSKTERKIN